MNVKIEAVLSEQKETFNLGDFSRPVDKNKW